MMMWTWRTRWTRLPARMRGMRCAGWTRRSGRAGSAAAGGWARRAGSAFSSASSRCYWWLCWRAGVLACWRTGVLVALAGVAAMVEDVTAVAMAMVVAVAAAVVGATVIVVVGLDVVFGRVDYGSGGSVAVERSGRDDYSRGRPRTDISPRSTAPQQDERTWTNLLCSGFSCKRGRWEW